jgi:myosin heavy subunit
LSESNVENGIDCGRLNLLITQTNAYLPAISEMNCKQAHFSPRYNLSQVEQWVREQGLDLDDSGVLTSLAEIRQASQLLQMNKSSVDNAAAIVETCYSLNTLQLQKLLMLYSPSSEFEERVPQDVIKSVLRTHFYFLCSE